MTLSPMVRPSPDEEHRHRFDVELAPDVKACRHCGLPKMLEKDFRRQVVDVAEATGWDHVGFRPAQTKYGWRTPGTGTMAEGWPDLSLVHARTGRLVFAELKGHDGKLDPAQEVVLDILRAIPCAEVYAWWPDDIEDVGRVLTP